jgi:hypothetical protein
LLEIHVVAGLGVVQFPVRVAANGSHGRRMTQVVRVVPIFSMGCLDQAAFKLSTH